MRALLLVICLLAATACDESSPAAPSVGLNSRFTLSPGGLAQVDGAGFRLQFVEVTGDSRCPGDAICIQGGDALVHVRVVDGGSFSYELHTGDSSRAAVVHGGFRIALEELQPYPFSSRPPIQPGDYRATFVVSRQ
jgi:hypothetical protein